MSAEVPPSELQTFDWQMDGGKDKSWGGKARSWIHDKPGRTRALSTTKVLAVWIPGERLSWPVPSSLALVAWIWALRAQASSMRSSASPTDTGETCLPPAGPESPSTRTFALVTVAVNLRGREEGARPELDTVASVRGSEGGSSRSYLLTSSAEDSHARTSPSPDDEPDSTEAGPDSSSSSPESLSLFDPDSYSSRTFRVFSLQTAVGTSEQSLERWPTSGTAWHGGFSTHVSSECRSDEDGCSSWEPSLSEILEEPQNVPAQYSLSARAARGILRRAEKRGKNLPRHLEDALTMVSSRTPLEHTEP